MNFPHFSGSWEPIPESTGALVLSHMTKGPLTNTHTHCTSRISTLILSCHLRLRQSGSFSSGFHNKIFSAVNIYILYIIHSLYSFPCVLYVCPSHPPSFDLHYTRNTVSGQKKKSRSSLMCTFSTLPLQPSRYSDYVKSWTITNRSLTPYIGKRYVCSP
jgi:hypothetical protein